MCWCVTLFGGVKEDPLLLFRESKIGSVTSEDLVDRWITVVSFFRKRTYLTPQLMDDQVSLSYVNEHIKLPHHDKVR